MRSKAQAITISCSENQAKGLGCSVVQNGLSIGLAPNSRRCRPIAQEHATRKIVFYARSSKIRLRNWGTARPRIRAKRETGYWLHPSGGCGAGIAIWCGSRFVNPRRGEVAHLALIFLKRPMRTFKARGTATQQFPLWSKTDLEGEIGAFGRLLWAPIERLLAAIAKLCVCCGQRLPIGSKHVASRRSSRSIDIPFQNKVEAPHLKPRSVMTGGQPLLHTGRRGPLPYLSAHCGHWQRASRHCGECELLRLDSASKVEVPL